jgi:hypothetical protein
VNKFVATIIIATLILSNRLVISVKAYHSLLGFSLNSLIFVFFCFVFYFSITNAFGCNFFFFLSKS